jgi:hypothetical protein
MVAIKLCLTQAIVAGAGNKFLKPGVGNKILGAGRKKMKHQYPDSANL